MPHSAPSRFHPRPTPAPRAIMRKPFFFLREKHETHASQNFNFTGESPWVQNSTCARAAGSGGSVVCDRGIIAWRRQPALAGGETGRARMIQCRDKRGQSGQKAEKVSRCHAFVVGLTRDTLVYPELGTAPTAVDRLDCYCLPVQTTCIILIILFRALYL